MIILHEVTPVGTVIRMIMGAESEAMIRAHGNIMVDIAPLLANVPREQPLFIAVSQVDNEIKTAELMKKSGISPPFYSPMMVISPALPNQRDMAPSTAPGTVSEKPTVNPASMIVKMGKCTYCGAGNKEVIKIKNGQPMCAECLNLNMALANKHTKSKKGTNESKSSI